MPATTQDMTIDAILDRTGLTYRQLDYWSRTGVLDIPSRGSGIHRRWDVHDVAVLRSLARLRLMLVGENDGYNHGQGAPLKRLRQVSGVLRGASSPGWVIISSENGVAFVPDEEIGADFGPALLSVETAVAFVRFDPEVL